MARVIELPMQKELRSSFCQGPAIQHQGRCWLFPFPHLCAMNGSTSHPHLCLLGFSAALAPKFTHSLAGLGFADGVVFRLLATAGSARDPHGSPRPRRSPKAPQGSPGLPGGQRSPGFPRPPQGSPGLLPSAVYPPHRIGLEWFKNLGFK